MKIKNLKLKIKLSRSKIIILGLLVGVQLAYLFFSVHHASAAWFDDSYTYRQTVSFTHNTDITSERRVSITINSSTLISASKMQIDCDDTRFTDINGKVLRYQLVSGCNTTTTVYDVVFPAIINGTNSSFIYYGNPSAISASDSAVAQVTNLTPSGSPSAATEENAPSPTAYWNFDEGYGTTTHDASSNNNTGTLGGSTLPTWQNPGQCMSNNCLFFDGSSSKVTGSVVAKNVQTVSFWIRPNTIASQGLVDVDGGTHKLNTNGSGVVSAAGFTSPTYYLNGKSVSSLTLVQNQWNYVTVTTGTGFDSSSSWKVGTDGTNFIKGFLDDVKLYSYARSAAQVQLDYNVGLAKGASAVLGASQNSILSNGLVGYWKMDESSWTNDCSTTSVTDSSGNGTNGKACPSSTGPTGGSAGKFGNAGSFDGSNDYVNLGSSCSIFNNSEYTISMWIKPAAAMGSEAGLMTSAQVYPDIGLRRSNLSNVLQFYRNDTGGTLESTFTATANAWSHVVVTFSTSTGTRLYGNGLLNASDTYKTILGCGSNDLVLGVDYTVGSGRNFYGDMDDVRIYKRELSASEVSQLYNWTPGPVGYWDFNEKSGTSANDKSGLDNTGTLTNGPSWTTGKYGGGIDLAGSDAHVIRADDADFDFGTAASFSYGAWIKHNTASALEMIVDKYDATAGNGGFKLYMESDGDLTCGIDDDEASFPEDSATSTAATYDDNNWHYISCVKDGTTGLYLYIDGLLTASDTTISSTGDFANADPLYIGIAEDGTSNDWIGQLDDVKIYNYARTSKQVIQDMNAGHPFGGITGVVGYWKMNEGTANSCSGAVNDSCDSSGFNNDGAWNGSASSTTDGKFGYATHFSANTSDYIKVNANSSMNNASFSISGWFKPTLLGVQMLMTKSNYANSWRLFMQSGSGVLEFDAKSDAENLVSASGLSAGVWTHVVATFDADTKEMKIYINGVLNKSRTAAQDIGGTYNSDFRIGSSESGNYFAGNIDEVKLYNGSLTAEQVKLDYNRGRSIVFGSLSTDNAGTIASQSGARAFCIPGDTSTCNAPIGEWKFEEGTGTTANDTSTNSNTGTVTNGPLWTVGKVGGALSFDGSNDYVGNGTGVDVTGTNITIEGWVKTTSSGSQVITGKWKGSSDNNSQYLLGVGTLNPGKVQLWISTGTAGAYDVTESNSTVNDGNWHYITGVQDATKQYIYIDGKLDKRATASRSMTSQTTASEHGAFNSGGSSQFNGILDEIRVYNYTRTPGQIAWDYNRGNPVGWWKLNECSGSTANDSSGNGNNATITIGGSGAQTSVGDCATSATTAWYSGRSGKQNASINLDGNDDYAVTGNAALLAANSTTYTNASWGGWVYPTSSAASKTIIHKSTEFRLTTDASSKPVCDIYTGGAFTTNTAASTNIALSLNAWNHVLCTYDGTNLRVYVNGLQTDSWSQTNTITSSSSTALNMGRDSASSGYVTGQIDDIRVFNYALTATQVKTLINNNAAVRFAPLTGSP